MAKRVTEEQLKEEGVELEDGEECSWECCEEWIELWSWTNRKEEAGREKQGLKLCRRHPGILKRRERDGKIFLAEDTTDLRRSEMGEFLGVNKIPGEARRVGGGWVWSWRKGGWEEEKLGGRASVGHRRKIRVWLPWGSACYQLPGDWHGIDAKKKKKSTH